jgi:hypothetical protein
LAIEQVAEQRGLRPVDRRVEDAEGDDDRQPDRHRSPPLVSIIQKAGKDEDAVISEPHR